MVTISSEYPRRLFVIPYSFICPHVSLQEGHSPRRARRVWCTTQVGLPSPSSVLPLPRQTSLLTLLSRDVCCPGSGPEFKAAKSSSNQLCPHFSQPSLVGVRKGACKANSSPLILETSVVSASNWAKPLHPSSLRWGQGGARALLRLSDIWKSLLTALRALNLSADSLFILQYYRRGGRLPQNFLSFFRNRLFNSAYCYWAPTVCKMPCWTLGAQRWNGRISTFWGAVGTWGHPETLVHCLCMGGWVTAVFGSVLGSWRRTPHLCWPLLDDLYWKARWAEEHSRWSIWRLLAGRSRANVCSNGGGRMLCLVTCFPMWQTWWQPLSRQQGQFNS